MKATPKNNHSFGPDQPFHWVQDGYMKQDEYDEILSDPTGFSYVLTKAVHEYGVY